MKIPLYLQKIGSKKKSCEIIFQNETPKALGFLTALWYTLQNSQFRISEIGVDATCKYL